MSPFPSTLYPLSHPQLRELVTEETHPGTGFANIPFTVRLEGPDFEKLEIAIHRALERHDGLRTRFVADGFEWKQYILAFRPRPLEILDFSGAGGQARWDAWLKDAVDRPIPWKDADLFRFVLLKFGPSDGGFFLNIHHAILDGWAVRLLIEEILADYRRLVENNTFAVENRSAYLDYLGAEKAYLASPDASTDRDFWLKALEKPGEDLVFPFARQKESDILADVRTFTVPDEAASQIRSYCESNRSSFYRLALAASFIYASRVTGNQDIIIGVLTHNRQSERDKSTVGMYVNALPLRCKVDQLERAGDLARRLDGDLRTILKKHSRYPIDLISKDLRERDGKVPGFLNFILAGQDFRIEGADVRYHHALSEQPPFSLVVNVMVTGGAKETLELQFTSPKGLFTADDAARMNGHLVSLIQDVMKSPEKSVAGLEMLPGEERTRLLDGFTGVRDVLPGDGTVIDLIRERVAAQPDHIALVYEEHTLTYRELDEKTDRLAVHLQGMGLGPERIAGILVEPSLEMFVGAIAALKAGAAYLPIDAKYNGERVRFMLEDSKAMVLLTHRELGAPYADFGGAVLDLLDPSLYEGPGKPATLHGQSNLAYVIYTSGSTGKPKGVCIEHRALLNLSLFMVRDRKLTPEDRSTKFASFGFDVSIAEMYAPLMAGCTIHVLTNDVKLSLTALNDYLEKHRITYAFLPTQYGEQFMLSVDNRSLRTLDVAGEKLQRFVPRRYELFNCYGPTEFTVYSTQFKVVKDEANIPIGKPLANCEAYIVNERNQLAPIGVAGELCFAGENLGRGYLNRPELTAERFVENPFRPGTKMYRTGDLAKWRANGEIEFIGRRDFQVKIRGFRIELGEIERQMLGIPGVCEAVVVDLTDSSGNKFLCGYYSSATDVSPDELREVLGRQLPDYMVPAQLVRLERLPLNPSGKIDRKALPKPVLRLELTPPANGVEEALVTIWKDILKLEEVGTTDDFFQIGGHSLKAVQLQARIAEAFHVEFGFKEIRQAKTIRALSQLIVKSDKVRLATIEKTPDARAVLATPSQRRLFFVQQLEGTGTTYNLPLVIRLDGPLDERGMKLALDTLIERHEALRTSFTLENGQPVQTVHPRIRVNAFIEDADESRLASIVREFVEPFDLTKAPLLRVKLLRMGPDRHALLLDVHHSVFDGSSMVILLDELMEIYAGKRLPPLRIQYRDYAAWLDRILNSSLMATQEKFWLSMYPDSVPVLELPTDFPRPAFLDSRGAYCFSRLEPELTERVKKLSEALDTSPYVVLLSAYFALLAKYAGQDDIVVGTGTAGRNHVDTQRLIGMFVNTLPIRAFPEPEKSVKQFILEVNSRFLDAFENQDYPFERLVEKLNLRRDTSRTPLFDAGLVYQSMGWHGVEARGVRARLEPFKHGIAHTDLLLEAVDDADGSLVLNWEYRKCLFREDTIWRLTGHYLRILTSFCENPDVQLKNISMLSPAEEKRLLFEFNQTDAEWPKEKTAHQIIEEMADRFPDRVAVTFEEENITYRDLNTRANQLARRLRDMGARPDTLVGILLDRGAEMIVAMLGVLKSGAGYLPIIPEYPQDRIEYMLSDSKAPILLSSENLRSKADGFTGTWLNVHDPALHAGDSSNPECVNKPSDIIYTIYTSGSTGRPKGVMLEHRNIVRLFINDRLDYELSEKDVWSLFHSFSFDFSVWEIFGALLHGGRVVVVPKSVALDPALFVLLCKKEGVTILSQTPGAFYNFIDADLKRKDQDLSIRYVTFGGEALKPGLLREWHHKYPKVKLINMYGITETTVHVTFKEIGDYEIEHNISNIGRPIPTLRTYIMDPSLKLLPVGVPGEICVGGDGVARGYLGLKEKTAERFVPNPYLPCERIYRSGDLARLLPGGEMEYLGRIDFQVKIRGFRIELGEIENRLMSHEAIDKAVVLAKVVKGGDKQLVAYFTATSKVETDSLRQHLRGALPEYMVPSFFVEMNEFPLTVNGKVDRKALPEPQVEVESGKLVEAISEAETLMLSVWKKVLGVEQMGVTDDFFALGGHSLRAVALVSELQKNFEVTVNDVFECPSVRRLSGRVRMKEKSSRDRIFDIVRMIEARNERTAKWMERPDVLAGMRLYQNRVKAYAERDYSRTKAYHEILLSGPTGFLGAYLLQTLLEQKTARVTVIVRGKGPADARGRLEEKAIYYFGTGFLERYRDRLTILCGDLSKPKFGLDDVRYLELVEKVDCILHPAALVKHYGHYQEFFDANVQAVKNLISFARAGRPKDFHHISTLSVAEGKAADRDHVVLSEFDTDLGQRTSNYYVRSKFEAELEVLKAREEGVNANIYRVGNISIHSLTGHLQENLDENAFYLQMKAFINLGAVPSEDDEVEFSFVDRLSHAIVLLFDREGLRNETFHLWNAHILKLSEILREPVLGLHVKPVTLAEFVKFLHTHYDQAGFREHIDAVMLHRGYMGAISSGEEAGVMETGFTILSDKTQAILAKLGFRWPELDPAVLTRMAVSALRERMAFLAETPLFRGLPEENLATLASIARLAYATSGDLVQAEGELGDGLRVLLEGKAEMYASSASGWLGTIGVLSRGDYFGEEHLVPARPSRSSVETLFGPVSMLQFAPEDLREAAEKAPRIAFSLAIGMTERINLLRKMVVSLG